MAGWRGTDMGWTISTAGTGVQMGAGKGGSYICESGRGGPFRFIFDMDLDLRRCHLNLWVRARLCATPRHCTQACIGDGVEEIT